MSEFIDIPQKKTLADIGLDQFGQAPLTFSGSEINKKSQVMYEAGVPSNFIQNGDFIQRLNVIDGWLQSANFVTGTTGWRIDSDGNVEFSNGYFRGDISAATGAFAGTVSASNITAGTISSKSIVLAITAGTGDTEIRSGIATGDFANAGTATGFILGLDDSDSDKPKFYIGSPTKYLVWDGNNLTIRGTLNADDIVAGTLTGRTVKAVGTGVASDVWLDGAVGEVAFYYGGTKIADLYSDTSGRVLLSSTSQSIYLTAGTDFYTSGDNWFAVSNSDLNSVFNDNGGSDSARWVNDTSLTMEHRDNGDLAISGSYL